MSKTIPSEAVFISAAELFAMLSTPLRLQIISALCAGEKNVTQLREAVQTTQPNMSQHLAMLYRSGILARRREGNQIYYRIQSERAATLCRAVCTQLAIELEPEANIPASDRLLPVGVRG